jgi:hypothetical protein
MQSGRSPSSEDWRWKRSATCRRLSHAPGDASADDTLAGCAGRLGASPLAGCRAKILPAHCAARKDSYAAESRPFIGHVDANGRDQALARNAVRLGSHTRSRCSRNSTLRLSIVARQTYQMHCRDKCQTAATSKSPGFTPPWSQMLTKSA